MILEYIYTLCKFAYFIIFIRVNSVCIDNIKNIPLFNKKTIIYNKFVKFIKVTLRTTLTMIFIG